MKCQICNENASNSTQLNSTAASVVTPLERHVRETRDDDERHRRANAQPMRACLARADADTRDAKRAVAK
jgi:hypothetical protein